jgi:hypothetical protein
MIKFCIKLNENTTESYEKLKGAYGEHSLLRAQVFIWQKAFCMAVRLWKKNLILEDIARQKWKKM